MPAKRKRSRLSASRQGSHCHDLRPAYNLAKLGVIKDLGELLELTIDELSQ
jgi:hypothetical protein